MYLCLFCVYMRLCECLFGYHIIHLICMFELYEYWIRIVHWKDFSHTRVLVALLHSSQLSCSTHHVGCCSVAWVHLTSQGHKSHLRSHPVRSAFMLLYNVQNYAIIIIPPGPSAGRPRKTGHALLQVRGNPRMYKHCKYTLLVLKTLKPPNCNSIRS